MRHLAHLLLQEVAHFAPPLLLQQEVAHLTYLLLQEVAHLAYLLLQEVAHLLLLQGAAHLAIYYYCMKWPKFFDNFLKNMLFSTVYRALTSS